ncbi:hypothetical protein JVT61DRAFT_6959 [Boletus reticuloceps]|uniref:Uncharacterized protein n=1 Tax=Boletus reticuloceps TaxID=495285 RepID=A0A8I2YIY4_9AGAM|nr:hypothetical protein JVT61DRAFT_6959 [Boletus reticuloceps]
MCRNGGTQPLTPRVGDFWYDFSVTTFNVYCSDGWASFTLEDVESLVCHPSGNNAILLFTGHAILYWMLTMTLGPGENLEIEFNSINVLFIQFEMTYGPNDFTVVRMPAVKKRKIGEQELEGDEDTRKKQRGAFAGPSMLRGDAKDPVSTVINTEG